MKKVSAISNSLFEGSDGTKLFRNSGDTVKGREPLVPGRVITLVIVVPWLYETALGLNVAVDPADRPLVPIDVEGAKIWEKVEGAV